MRASKCAEGDLDDGDQKDPIQTPTKADRLWYDYDEHKNNPEIKPLRTIKKKLDKCIVFSFSRWYSKTNLFSYAMQFAKLLETLKVSSDGSKANRQ